MDMMIDEGEEDDEDEEECEMGDENNKIISLIKKENDNPDLHQLVLFILKNGKYEVGLQDENKMTSLMHTCIKIDEKLVRLLLNEGENTNATDLQGNTALLHLLFSFELKLKRKVKKKKKKKKRKKRSDFDDEPTRKEDIINSCLSIVKMLIANGANRYIRNNIGKSSLDFKCCEKVEVFLKTCPDTIFENVMLRNEDELEDKLKNGHIISQRDNTGRTLAEVLMTTRSENKEIDGILKILFDYGYYKIKKI